MNELEQNSTKGFCYWDLLARSYGSYGSSKQIIHDNDGFWHNMLSISMVCAKGIRTIPRHSIVKREMTIPKICRYVARNLNFRSHINHRLDDYIDCQLDDRADFVKI